jgi:hypothetical protein
VTDAQVQTTYECSGRGFGYDYRCRDDGLDLVVISSGSDIQFHLMLPPGRAVRTLAVDGQKKKDWGTETIEASHYMNFSAPVKGEVGIRADFS